MRARWDKPRAALASFAGYLALALLLARRAVADLTGRVVGVPDLHVWEELWHFWWTREALSAGASPFVSPLLGYPDGMNVFFDMSSITLPFASLPLQWIAGPVGAYNLIAVLCFTLAGWGTCLVCRRLGAAPPAAFVGGVIFGFSPFLQTELSNGMMENLFAFTALPFFLLLLLRMHDRGRWLDGLWAGLVLAFGALSSWYVAPVALTLAAVLLVARLAAASLSKAASGTEDEAAASRAGILASYALRYAAGTLQTGARVLRKRVCSGADRRYLHSEEVTGRIPGAGVSKAVLPHAVMIVVFALLVAYPLWTLVKGPTLERGVPWRDTVRGPLAQKSCIDLTRLFTHGAAPPAVEEPGDPDNAALTLLPFGVYLGKLTAFLALLGVILCRRDRRWAAGFLVFVLLALGPYLNIGGRLEWFGMRVPLPARLLVPLPGLGRLFALHNYRFIAGAMLCGAVLAASGMTRIIDAVLPGARHAWLAAILLSGLALMDFGAALERPAPLALPSADARIPAVYDALDDAPPGALFNVPLSAGSHTRPEVRGLQMYHQLRHRRPIPCDPIYVLDPVDKTSLARAARNMLRYRQWNLEKEQLAEDLARLRDLGYGFLAVHRHLLSPADGKTVCSLLDGLLGSPVAADDGIAIYAVARGAPHS